MIFLVLLSISAIVLIVAPLFIAKRYSREWQLEKKIFWKAGLAAILIQIFYTTVLSNISVMMGESNVSMPLNTILIYGISAALFYELGRFLVLDKCMKTIRSLKEGFYFAMGWSGVSTLLMGIGLFIGLYALNILLKNGDLSSLIPPDSQVDLPQLKEFQDQILLIAKDYPYFGLQPLIERASWFVVDIALTLMVLFGITSGTSKLIWGAVAFRAIFASVLLFVNVNYGLNFFIIIAVLLAFSYISYRLIRQLIDAYPRNIREN